MREAIVLGTVSIWALSTAACGPGDGPWIDRIEPAAAARGAAVTVRGQRFCGDGRATADGSCDPLPPGSVVFGLDLPAARGLVLAWADQEISVQVPAASPVGSVDVVVTVDGRSSNGVTVEVTP